MFFKHFASKNQLPGFYISGTLVENGLIFKNVIKKCFWYVYIYIGIVQWRCNYLYN